MPRAYSPRMRWLRCGVVCLMFGSILTSGCGTSTDDRAPSAHVGGAPSGPPATSSETSNGATDPRHGEGLPYQGNPDEGSTFVAPEPSDSVTLSKRPMPTATSPQPTPLLKNGKFTNSLVEWEKWPDRAELRSVLSTLRLVESTNNEAKPPADMVMYDAALAVAMAHVGMPGLYRQREGNELDFYEPLRPYVTTALWDALAAHIDGAASDPSFSVGSFAPQTDRNGVWASVDGVVYRSTGASSIVISGVPRVSLQGKIINISFEITVTGHGKPADLTYETLYTAVMAYEDDRWKINGWNNHVLQEVRPVDARAVVPN